MTSIAILKISLNLAEGIAFLSALYKLYTTKSSDYKYLTFYFLFIILAEQIGNYFVRKDLFDITKYWYCFIVIPVEFFFFYWFLLNHFNTKKDRLIAKIGIAILIIGFIIDWLFYYNSKAVFISLSYTLGNLILLILVLRYFKNLIHSKRILNFTTELEFWICLGLLIFYLSTFPFFGLYNYFLENYPIEFRIYYIVMLVLNSVMYLIFSIGMLWTKPK